MRTITAKQAIKTDGFFNEKVKIKGSEFNKLDREIQCALSGGGMWLDVCKIESDQHVILDGQCVVIKEGKKIIGVVITDETCAWYEKSDNIYRLEDCDHHCLRSVNDVLEYHFK